MDKEKILPFADDSINKQTAVGNITFTPYQPKPFDVWLKEQASKQRKE